MQSLTSTGSIAAGVGMFRVGKKLPQPALRKPFHPAVIVVSASKQVVARHETTKTKPVKYRSRFSVQSVKRSEMAVSASSTLGPVALGVDYIKYAEASRMPSREIKNLSMGKTCQTRVVRKVIHVGRPEYLGAGQWSH